MLKCRRRQLDPKLSTPFRPYHTHAIEQKLKPNEWCIEAEIWATGMVFQKGSRIRVDVMSSDGGHDFSSYRLKDDSLYTGADCASYVLLPIVPTKPGAPLTRLGGIKVGVGGGE